MDDKIFTFLQFVGGLGALVGGATIFVDGAAALASRLRIPPIIIGLTVVALGTSAPEIGVNVIAALGDQSALAVGNVLGSNLLNILSVLGISALIAPLIVNSQVVRVDLPVMIGSAVLFSIFAYDGQVTRVEAAILLTILVAYTLMQIAIVRRARRSPKRAPSRAASIPNITRRPLFIEILFVVGGALLLVLGADWLVSAATTTARSLKIDERIIGLTVVAIGTSLPELAASMAAALKGERELAVGNVVGSNIYNILAVVGITGCISTTGLSVPPTALELDFPVMLLASFACIPIFVSGYKIERWEGLLFLSYYLLYLCYLFAETSHPGLAQTLAKLTPPALILTTVVAIIQWLRTFSRGRTSYHDASIRT